MEEIKSPLEKKIVFKYSADGIALFVFLCFIFLMGGIVMINSDNSSANFWGPIVIAFAVGLFFLVFKSWKPILTVSKDGITQPTLYKDKFVPWSEIKEIRFKTQTVTTVQYGYFEHNVKYIGVFTFAGRQDRKTSEQLITTLNKRATGWTEMPTLLISNHKMFSGVENEKIIEVMRNYHTDFVSQLPEDEKLRYEGVFHPTLKETLKNSPEFGMTDNNSNERTKVNEQINWEKLSKK